MRNRIKGWINRRINRLILALALIGSALGGPMTGKLYAASFVVDQAHSNLGFSLKHMVVSTVRGRFNDFSGSLEFDPATKELTRVDAEIQAGSIDTNKNKRDRHLRAPDFFDVTRYPVLRFRSTKIERIGEEYRVTGELTIKDVTKQLVLTGSYQGSVKGHGGKLHLGFVAEGEIDRYDFGIRYNRVLDQGGLSIGTKVKILLEIEAIEQ